MKLTVKQASLIEVYFLKKRGTTMDNTNKFSGISKEYNESRPSYAQKLIECMFTDFNLHKNSLIADIGSGTGKLAKQLLDRGCTVFCIEPNNDMRTAAVKELEMYKNFISVNANAENTTLENNRVDHITAAQSFHWFDTEKFRNECMRIIKKDGNVFLIWNKRDETSDINRELHQCCSEFCPDFKGFSGGINTHDQRIKDFFRGNYNYVTFNNPLKFDRDKFIKRCISASYSLKGFDKDFNRYIEALNKIFDKYETNGTLIIENTSDAYIGKVE
ncbi:MAG: class I SAM-dependent methyltransferase [Ruminococcaceae bacterium]|nr:class I SAM-dependent methyltransferase [Oscillospiraceae bacterium]